MLFDTLKYRKESKIIEIKNVSVVSISELRKNALNLNKWFTPEGTGGNLECLFNSCSLSSEDSLRTLELIAENRPITKIPVSEILPGILLSSELIYKDYIMSPFYLALMLSPIFFQLIYKTAPPPNTTEYFEAVKKATKLIPDEAYNASDGRKYTRREEEDFEIALDNLSSKYMSYYRLMRILMDDELLPNEDSEMLKQQYYA